MSQLKVWSKQIPCSTQGFFQKYHEMTANRDSHVLLESGRGGRFNIAGIRPEAILIGKNNELHIKKEDEIEVFKGNPLHLTNEYLNQFEVERNEELPDFQGGAIGFISYDYASYIENLPHYAVDDLNLPEVYFQRMVCFRLYSSDCNPNVSL